MAEPSILIDESGGFGGYEAHPPLYLKTFVFRKREFKDHDALMPLDRNVTPEEGARMDAPDFRKAAVAVAKNRYGNCEAVGFAFVRECGQITHG